MAAIATPVSAGSGTSDRRRAYWLAWTSTLLFFAGFYALLVPLPRYLADVGLPDWQIGLILGAFGVASVLGRPLAGIGVDRFGSRPVLLVGAVALLVGAGGVVLTANPIVLGILRLAQTVGYVAYTTAGTALVIVLTPEERRGRQMAIFGAAANTAITLSPAVTSLLIAYAPLAYGFFAASALALIAGLMALSIRPPRPSARVAAIRYELRDVAARLWPSMLSAFVFGAGFAAFFLFAPILSERRGMPSGLPYTVYGISIIATRVLGSRWLDRIGTRATLVLSAMLIVVGLLVAAVATTPLWLGVAAVLTAAGGGLFHPALIVHHARMLPGAPGQSTAVFYLGFDLGIGLGSWLYGVVLDLFGLFWLYVVGAALIALTLPLTRLLLRQLPPSPEPTRVVESTA
jgi:predicted MFS family arabinose efflux permease